MSALPWVHFRPRGWDRILALKLSLKVEKGKEIVPAPYPITPYLCGEYKTQLETQKTCTYILTWQSDDIAEMQSCPELL